MRLGVIRESMVYPAGSKTEEPIVDAADEGDQGRCSAAQLGATLVESSDPLLDARSRRRADDGRFPHGAGAAGAGVHAGPAVPAAGATARRCSRSSPPRSCRPSSCRARCSARGTMQPIDYCVALAEGRIAPPVNLDLGTIQQQEMANTFRFHISQYLIAARRRLEGQGLHRDAGRLGRAQRALQVLGRRPARRVQELGGGRRPAQSARPAPGRQRAHHAARTAAPRRHDGDPGEQARRAGAAAHAVAAGR